MMGDLVNHFEPLKKLGCFETSNQWILYDERFQKFFDFFTQNITEINVITEHEALEFDEMADDLYNFDEYQQKQQLEKYVPGILDCTDREVTLYSNEISAYSESEQHYIQLLEQTRTIKSEANSRLNELEHKNNMLSMQEKEFLGQCHSQVKELEILQEGNKKLYKESRNCFTKVLSPPMLFYQLPLEQYFAKCDSSLQYFTLYIQENYKIQEFSKLDIEERETEELTLKLKGLKNSIAEYTIKYFEEKRKAKVTQSMIDELALTQIHIISLNDLERESYERERLIEHHLRVAYGTLLNDLKALVDQHSQQRIELVLYENTKHKLDRALRRLENDKGLTKITSDALSNAELVWIGIQFDLERTSNRIDNTKQLTADSQACWKRIKAMHSLNVNVANNFTAGFVKAFADLLTESSCALQRISSETKSCLYEYEKFCRLLAYRLQKMLSERAYATSMDQLKELKNLEIMLEPLIYDSPIEAPLLNNVSMLRPIYNSKMKRIEIEKTLRQLRSQFQTNIVEKMQKDQLWRANQILWIWFLTQPKRLLMAMEEVKRAATNVPAFSEVKNLGGIKRK